MTEILKYTRIHNRNFPLQLVIPKNSFHVIEWNLADLYSFESLTKFQEDLSKFRKQAWNLRQNYQGQLRKYQGTPLALYSIIAEFDQYYKQLEPPILYATLLFNTNMTDSQVQQIYNVAKEAENEILSSLSFFRIELGELLHHQTKLLHSSALTRYHHFLQRIIDEFSHTLTISEEKLILEKDRDGISAWADLQSVWFSSREIKITNDGTLQKLPISHIRSLFSHPDPQVRATAIQQYCGKIHEDQEIYAYALRNIASNWVKMAKNRKYQSPLHPTLVSNDVSEVVIFSMMDAVQKNCGIYQKFLAFKAQMLGLEQMTSYDLELPLSIETETKYEWDIAKETIQNAYGKFDLEIQSVVKEMFDKNHIDATPKKGKYQGAFCFPSHFGQTGYISLNFDKGIEQLYTLSHELGHAIHSYYATRTQTYFNFNDTLDEKDTISSCLDETASVFGEIILSDWLLSNAESNREQKKILVDLLTNAGYNIFRMGAAFIFETNIYNAIEKGQNLDGQLISSIWQDSHNKVFGEAVQMSDEMKWLWVARANNFLPNQRYYNYPYIYCQLFAFAMYEMYQQDPTEFIPKYKKLLKAGGSVSCDEAGSLLGIDISSTDFWQKGLNQYQDFLTKLQNL